MDSSQITRFCQQFFQATYIPITHLRFPATLLTSQPQFSQNLELSQKLSQRVYFEEDKQYFLSDSFAFFGYVPLVQGDEYLVIGPIFSTPISPQHLSLFIKEFDIKPHEEEFIERLFQNTPTFSLKQCLSLLSFLELICNQRSVSFQMPAEDAPKQKALNIELSRLVTENREEAFIHNSYQFEKALHHALSKGNRTLVLKILTEAGQITNGIIADNTLRQQKNTFIVAVTLATRAAIEGGLEIEHAYSLSDLYIQECERLESVEEIISLTSLMYLDFTERVSKSQFNQELSSDIFRAVQFIQSNVNQPIQVEDVARVTGYSYSHFKTLFKSEIKMPISTFITKTKLDTARELLAYSDYSLSYISNYLCFSSQSYFQNQFKKFFGTTPLKYRQEHQLLDNH
ncbi:helix-turn-helix domain-containing protein [Streptococcus ovuberis]|uniref:Helix-turn-helix domain-containing protein n=1 Tax=Streptococcus ovuberis TaxID=1936207 RepID=A0A7X6MX53_9STRE|nr:helix-turn-helix domain-containing protein [Streptococcus ovuberis]NKZ20005.1 helix-turn-helix domain-containing protein [Streptococcus ovuberis]